MTIFVELIIWFEGTSPRGSWTSPTLFVFVCLLVAFCLQMKFSKYPADELTWGEVRPQRTKTVNMIAFQPEPFLISVTWHWCIASRLSASSSVLLCCDISANVTGDRRQHWGDYSSPSIWLNKPMTNKLSPWPRDPTVSWPQADGLL